MPVTLAEIEEAKEEFKLAQQAMNYADEDFLETAIYQQKIASLRLNALIRRAKEAGQEISIQSMVTDEPVWQFRVMDYIGVGVAIIAVLLGVTAVIINGGRLMNWW